MARKDSKKDKEKPKLKASKPKPAPRKRAPKPQPLAEVKPEEINAAAALPDPASLLGAISDGVCLFDMDDRVTFCNESFTVLTGLQLESLVGKKIKKDLLWAGESEADEFSELFTSARDSGKPVISKGLSVDAGEATKTWNLSLLPQTDAEGQYSGMALIIEDITERPLDITGADLFRSFYRAAVRGAGTQALLEELVAELKAFCRCAHVKIVIFDGTKEKAFIAETGKKHGLWDKDETLSPAVIAGLFSPAAGDVDDLFSAAGSVYLSDVSHLEDRLHGALKELVVNTCNSYGFTSLALIPVRLENQICGLIQLADVKPSVSNEIISTVENLSEQLQIILERAALKTEMRKERESLLKQMHERSAHLEALSERLRQEAAERRKAQEDLRLQKDLAVELAGIEDMSKALQLCLDTAIRVSGMDSGGIYLLDPVTGRLDLACSTGLAPDFVERVSHYEFSEPNAKLVAEGKSIFIAENIDGEPHDLFAAEGIKGLAAIPITHKGKIIASMNIASHVIKDIPQPVRSSLEAVAAEIGSAIARLSGMAALAESETRYQALFDGTADPILVYDTEGNYIDANQAALSFLECTRDELLKMNVRDTLPPYLDEKWFDQYRQIWKTGGRVERDYYVWGKIKVMELTITPLQLGDRQTVINIGKDVTERKRLEQDLHKSEEKYRTILEEMDEVCYEVDLKGNYTFFNNALCRQLGYTSEELQEINFKNYIPPEDINKTYEVFNEIYKTGQPSLWQPLVNIRKDGSRIYVEDSIFPIKNDLGEVTGFRGISREVTERKKAEDALKHSEQKYRTILEDIDESYYEIDSKGNLLFFNDACARRFGYTRQELVGMNYKVFTRPEDVKEKVRIFTKVFQTGKPRFTQPMINVRKDGSIAYVEDSIFPLRNDQGEIIGCRGIGRDVTERRRWEIALKESEEKFRRLFFESPVAAAIVAVDDFHFISVNEALCNLLGYTNEELAGLSFKDITHPDNLADDVEQIRRLAVGEIEQYVTDKRYIRKDGGEVWAHLSVRLIKDAEGIPLYYLPIIQDVTTQRKAEAALRESEAKYRSLVESGGAGIVTCNLAGEVNFVNDTLCKKVGFSRNELLGKPFIDFAHTDDQDEISRLFLMAVEGKLTDIHFETRVLHKDGHIIWFYVSPVALKIGDIVAGFSAILQDITELKQAEDKVEHLNLVLQAIRMVNQLIVREKDRSRLLQLTCDNLVYTRGFHSACLVLLDESRAYVTSAQSGLGAGFSNLVEDIKLGNFPYCMRCALEKSEPVEITNKIPVCTDCSLWTIDQGYPTMSIRLEYDNQMFGVLIVSIPEAIPFDVSEKELLIEVAGDISFALHNLELEEAKEESEEALMESEEHFRSLAEESPNIIFINTMGRLVYVNRKCEEIIGYTREEMYSEGFDFFKLVAPEYRDRLKENYAKHGRGEELEPAEYVLLTKNNSRIDAILSTRLITYDNNPAILGVVTDVTEIKRIERALSESENKYRIIMEETSEAYLEMDSKGYFTFVNDSTCQHLGYTREELLGLKYKAITIPEEIHERVAIWADVFQTGTPRHLVEFRNVRKDGSLYYTECSIFPLHNEKGEIVGLRTVALDITRRKLAEEELRKSEERYRTILEDIDEAYCEVDLNGNLIFFNDATCNKLGYTREEFTGINYKTYTPPEDIREKASIYSEVVRTGIPVYWHPFRNRAKDGTIMFSETSIFPLRNEKGEITGVRVITRDVTESRRAAQELEKRALMLDSTYDSIIAYDTWSNIIYANERACQTRGYTLDEMLKMNATELSADEDTEALNDRISRMIENGYMEFEALHKRKDGTTFPVSGSSRLVEVSGQSIIVSVYTDITLKKRNEKALVESEAEYRSLVESGGAGIATTDMEGNLTFVNDTLCNILGYSKDELLGRPFIGFMLEEDGDLVTQVFLAAVGGTRSGIKLEFRARHKDGHLVWLYTNPMELRYGDRVAGFSAILTDVTERKLAEETVRLNEERYRTILDDLQEYYAEVDTAGNFTFVNDALCRHFGYSREEMLNLNYKVYVPPESAKERLRVFSDVFLTGKPAYSHLFEDIIRDGSRRFVEISIFPRRNEKGEIVGLRTVGRDVTDRRKAEERLQNSEERYRLLAENALDVIFTTDLNGKVTYISPSMTYLSGHTPQEIMRSLQESIDLGELFGISAGNAENIRKAWLTVVGDPAKTQLLEFDFKHSDGFRAWAELKMSIVRDKNGKMSGVQGVMRDISQQKKMTERLVSADRLASLGEMAAGLAHEVNNPLTAVMGFAYLLLQNPDLPPETKGDVEAIYREGKRAADVIRNFLIFARGQKPQKQAIYLNDTIEGVLRLRSSQMEKENIEVVLNLAEDLPAIQGDISQLQQVFLNIVLNAEYFMYQAHRRGTISISTQKADSMVKVAIADDGPGIPQDRLSRVFDPFYTTKDVGEGTGLGLSICHGTVREHGGNIYVDSEVGKGATFTIELPVSN